MMYLLQKTVILSFLAGFCTALPEGFVLDYHKLGIFEDLINKSIECVKDVLQTGIPDLDFPPLDPMRFHSFPIDFDRLNLPKELLSGYINNTNVGLDRVTQWKMQNIKGQFKLIPPTYTVNFSLHYDSIAGYADYEGNITVSGHNLWGKGKIYSEVQNLVAAGHVKAVIDDSGVHMKEFAAPITLEKYIFNITGLKGDEELSKKVSEEISANVPKIVNANPQIFTNYVSPVLMYIFDQLVNNDAGVGIVRRMVKKCIIDVINPPHFS